jgi:MFS transporter, DHA1 family, arabinose polymer utilization protein
MKLSLLPLALGGLTIGITEFVMMGLLPDIATDLDVSITQAGYLISAYALGVVIGAPLLVVAGRNYPPKKMLVLLAIMLLIFNGLSIAAPDFDLLLITRLLSGLPHGAFFGVGAVVAARLADKGKEARSVAIMFSGLTVANVLGVPLGTYVGHHLHWRYTFVIIAVIGLLTVLAMLLWMPALKRQDQAGMRSQMVFFKKPQAWLIIFIVAVGTGGLFCWISYISKLLTDISGFKEADVPYILMLAGVGMVVGNFLGARLADRFSPAYAVLGTLLFMALILTGVYFLSENKIISLVFVFATGCLAFALVAPIQMLMIQTAKGSEMIASAVIQASFNIGNALGAYLGGLPIERYGFAAPNLVGVTMAVLGALGALIFIKVYPLVRPDEKVVVMH